MVDTVFSEEDTAAEDGSAESAEEDGEASVMDSGCDKSKDGFRTRRARDEEQKEEGNERGQEREALQTAASGKGNRDTAGVECD